MNSRQICRFIESGTDSMWINQGVGFWMPLGQHQEICHKEQHMRYIKVLLLAVFFFLAMVFFFQNQAPLSQETELGLNLFFIPPMKAIALPFYFIVIAAFLVGCLFAMVFLLWEKFAMSAKLMKTRWEVGSLQREVGKMKKQLDNAQKTAQALKALPNKDQQASE